MVFMLSKLFWAVFNPGAMLAAGLGLGGIASILPWRRARRFGRVLLACSVVASLVVAVFPLDVWLLSPLERRFRTPDPMPRVVDGIVVLGGAIDLRASASLGAPELNGHGDRLLAFAALARMYPAARLVFTGGSGLLSYQRFREADFVPAALNDMGLDPTRVLFERNSRNTRENATMTKAIMKPRQGETWLLITSASHMPRAIGAFRGAGWEVVPYPVDFVAAGREPGSLGFDLGGSLANLTLAMHEWVGLVAYRILGWSGSLFPAPAQPARQAVNESLTGLCENRRSGCSRAIEPAGWTWVSGGFE